MKKYSKILIISIIIIIIIIICTIIALLKISNNETSNNIQNNIENNIYEENDVEENQGDSGLINNNINIVKKVDNRTNYYLVKGFANTYIERMQYNNIDILMSTLESDYIQSYSITKDNIKSKIPNSYWDIGEYEVTLIIDNMYYAPISDVMSVYFLYGKTKNTKTNNIEKFNLIVVFDEENITYAIFPSNYLKDKGYENVKESQKVNFNLKPIKANNYNQYGLYEVKDEDLLKDYLYRYKYLVLNEKENAYNLLNEEYREKKFGNYSNYLNYIKEDNKLAGSIIQKYKVNNYDNYTEYICIDQYGRHYIFRETAVMQYTVLLDDYTVETEEYKESYEKSSENVKVNTNINKFIKMLNNGDYQQMYNLLNQNFKNNYYPTLDKFKAFLKSKVFENNGIEFENYNKKGNNHISEIKIYDMKKAEKEPVTMNIIMQLHEGTAFEMSFNFP